MVCQCCDSLRPCDYEQSPVVTVWIRRQGVTAHKHSTGVQQVSLGSFFKHLLCYCTFTHRYVPMLRFHADGCVHTTNRWTPHPLCIFFYSFLCLILEEKAQAPGDMKQEHKSHYRLWFYRDRELKTLYINHTVQLRYCSYSNTHQIISLN